MREQINLQLHAANRGSVGDGVDLKGERGAGYLQTGNCVLELICVLRDVVLGV